MMGDIRTMMGDIIHILFLKMEPVFWETITQINLQSSSLRNLEKGVWEILLQIYQLLN